MEKAQDIEATNLVKNTMREKVGPGVFWSVLWLVLFVSGIFFLLRQSICSLLTSFILMDHLREWRNHTQAEGPFLPSPLLEFELALPNTGPVLEGSALGKCRSRISRGLCITPLCSALQFRHREEGRVLADPTATLPHTAICRASEQSHKDDMHPRQAVTRISKTKGNIWRCPDPWWCMHTTEGVNWCIEYVYQVCTG